MGGVLLAVTDEWSSSYIKVITIATEEATQMKLFHPTTMATLSHPFLHCTRGGKFCGPQSRDTPEQEHTQRLLETSQHAAQLEPFIFSVEAFPVETVRKLIFPSFQLHLPNFCRTFDPTILALKWREIELLLERGVAYYLPN